MNDEISIAQSGPEIRRLKRPFAKYDVSQFLLVIETD
jgi:hypothetical protein